MEKIKRGRPMSYGQIIPVGTYQATRLADMDFETYSEVGYKFNKATGKWTQLKKGKHGLALVGAWCYSEHETTEVQTLAYDLKDGVGPRLWTPGLPPPYDLFEHIGRGLLVEAFYSFFEYSIWTNVCVKRMGWPPLPLMQLRDAAAKARAWGLPGALAKCGAVLGADIQKDAAGSRMMKKLCKPRNHTKKDKRDRYTRDEDPADYLVQDLYCIDDIRAEEAISIQVPDLSPREERVWLMDQRMNANGVHLDVEGVENCINVFEQAQNRYHQELQSLTGGCVMEASKAADTMRWTANRGVHISDLREETVTATLKRELPQDVRRVLEIRQLLAMASVKKLYSMRHQRATDNRVHGIFAYHKAGTGRWASTDLQLQNFTSGGPEVMQCGECDRYHWAGVGCTCGIGGLTNDPTSQPREWGIEGAEAALADISTKSLDYVEQRWGNAVLAISGCLRALITAAPGNELIVSDYNAIEARGLAWLAGEEWRLDVFRDHGKIYEMSASKITGVTFEEMMAFKKAQGQHHPDRKKGKVAELALGYQGWLGALRAFGADKFMNEEEMKGLIMQWRADSPAIVEFWGGQYRHRGKPWEFDYYEYYGVEGAAIQAILNPGSYYSAGRITFGVKDDCLYMQLPSGRLIAHHRPRLTPTVKFEIQLLNISYEGVNGNPKRGPQGQWMRIDTYGGSLVETAVQGMCRDWHAFAMLDLEQEGYTPVFHVHDEPAAEVPRGFGSVEHMESIMMRAQDWAPGCPIKASGGWRGQRYRKD